MANVRPDGQTLNSTNISFMSSLWAVKDNTLEEKVQILWTGILHTWFPPIEPYRIVIKAAVLAGNTALDAIVFEIHHCGELRSSRDIQERQIFMAVCKKSSEDTQAGWNSARDQLLTNIEDNSNTATWSGIYGACAIGRKVVFFEWTRASGQLTAISGLLDMYHPAHRPLVEDMLNHVKQYAFFTINRWRRRVVFMVSGTGMALCMACLAVATSSPKTNVRAQIASVIFIFIFNSFIPIDFWSANFLSCTEIAPLRIRTAMANFCIADHWLWNFVVTMITPVAIHTINYRYYIVYACIGSLIPLTVYFFYPETKGRSLEDIDANFRNSSSLHKVVDHYKHFQPPNEGDEGDEEVLKSKSHVQEKL